MRPEDEQLEQIIHERNEFERENIRLKSELGAFKSRRNWTRPYNYTGVLINEHALYIPKLNVEAMRAWHTLPGETPKKDARIEMTQDNFYRVIAMSDELIHEQKTEIASLKSKINKLEQKSTKENIRLKSELGEMCEAMINIFNGGFDEEHQKVIDEDVNRLINKNKQYVSK